MPDEDSGGAQNRRNETELERLDRNLAELLSELRVAQTGVQFLFAFLLILPFNTRFADVTEFERVVYIATLAFTTASAGFLIAPSAHHRLLFRRDDKRYLVFSANRTMIYGLGCLALAMTGAVLLVTSFVLGSIAAAVATTASVAFLAAVWYGLPIRRRRRLERQPAEPDLTRSKKT
jgi:hypothetical protein